ncbi:MAG: hypothetical protein Q4F76_00285 [Lachnospiraceae bacterium]|nr:hypothetical protein [Lachnospiraceae bacterium]
MEIIMILAALAAFFGFAMARAADQGDRLPGPGQLTKVPKMEKPVNVPELEKSVNVPERGKSVNLSADKKRQPSEGCRKEGMKKISM